MPLWVKALLQKQTEPAPETGSCVTLSIHPEALDPGEVESATRSQS
jgi:hypothetical protein